MTRDDHTGERLAVCDECGRYMWHERDDGICGMCAEAAYEAAMKERYGRRWADLDCEDGIDEERWDRTMRGGV